MRVGHDMVMEIEGERDRFDESRFDPRLRACTVRVGNCKGNHYNK